MTDKKKSLKKHVVTAHEDDNGDLLIPIPPILLKRLGWTENDTIEVTVDENTGEYILKKA
jgi:bifunctional DNA-binding transcriptional regulator/antitoxin component of YhaV-PrlF toxin-antitoxin module